MKLAGRLTLSLTAAILLVLSVNAAIRVRREAGLFEADIRRDGVLLGRAIAGVVSRIWERVGEAEALDLVEAADERESHVILRWIWLDQDDAIMHRLLSESQLHTLHSGGEVVAKGRAEGDRYPWLYVYLPVDVPGERRAVIELKESLEAEASYIRRTVLHAALATGALVLLCGIIVGALGSLLVGRRVATLVEHARRIGAGDLTTTEEPGRPGRRDEIGQLVTEMNAMCLRLQDARDAVFREHEARLRAQDQLRHADRLSTVGTLASGIAHEVGTPLNVITGHAQIILEDYPPDSPAHRNALIVAEQVDRVAQIIRQLLDFARRRGPHRERVDLRDLIRRTAALLEPLARKRDVTISVHCPDEPVAAAVDVGQMQQVVTNLAVNGLHAMTGGGVLGLSVETSGARVRIAVDDEGEGIPEDVKSHMFEPFFTTKEIGEGTGLGLSVAYGIVDDHGGSIVVEETGPGGTRVSVLLPVEEGAEEAETAERAEA